MKDDAISRKAVIDFITDIERRALDKSLKISNGNSDEVMKTVLATAKAIRGYCKLAPPAPPERKTGKWNFIGDQMFECTECGACYTQGQFHQMRVRITDSEFPKFCPNCGADMREQDE